MTSGTRLASAYSAARVTFSPTTAPIEPPMNPKSMTQIATGVPPIGAGPPHGGVAHAGRGLGRGEAVRVGLLVDEPERVHRLQAGVALRATCPWSSSCSRRAAADSRKWWPQVGQTRSALSSCLLKSISRTTGTWSTGRRVDVAPGAERRQLERHQASLVRATARTPRGPSGGRPGGRAPRDIGRAGDREGRRGQRAADEQRAGRGRVARPSSSAAESAAAGVHRRRPERRPNGDDASPRRRGAPASRRRRPRPRRAARRAPPRTGTRDGTGAGRAQAVGGGRAAAGRARGAGVTSAHRGGAGEQRVEVAVGDEGLDLARRGRSSGGSPRPGRRGRARRSAGPGG